MQGRATGRFRKLSLAVAAVAFGGAVWSSCSRLSSVGMPAEVVAAALTLPESVDYNLHVKPILSDRCFACHGPDNNKQQAGLRLDTPEGAYEALTESGKKAVVPGDLANSELFHRITSTDPEEMMPTPKSNLTLSAEEKAILIRWVEQGAEYKEHWSLVAPTMPDVPDNEPDSWSRNDIDRFVLAKLREKKISHAPEADKTTLLRRVSLDLTGLPPTPAEMAAFLADKSADVYENVVDRLLKSPQYGERQAAEWMDVARYADTHGYQDDGLRTMWPFRDWVIRSFNQNQPFDQFVTWQLAGDLLPRPANPNDRRDQLLATAFNRNHQQTQEGGVVDEEYRVEYVADRVATFGKAFLGLTTECARCHDHKYDPISQKDYFSLFAFFNSNNERGQIPYNGEAAPTLTLLSADEQAQLKHFQRKLAAVSQRVKSNQLAYQSGFNQWLRQAERRTNVPDELGLVARYTFDEENRTDIKAYETKRDADSKRRDEARKRAEAKQAKTGKPAAEKKEVRTPKTRVSVEADPRNAFANTVSDTLHASLGGDVDNLPKAVAGRFDKARFLPGDSYISLPGNVGEFDQNQPFTISSWLKINKLGTSMTLMGRTTGPMDGQRGYQLDLLPDGRLKLLLSHVWPANAIDLETVGHVPAGQWFQVAFTYDGLGKAGGLTLYLNGQPMPVRVITDHLIHSMVWGKNKSHWAQHSFYVGRMHDYFYKDFAVDELRIYSRCLTPLELPRLAGKPDALAVALRTPASTRTPAQQTGLYTYYLRTQDRTYRAALDSALVYRGRQFMTLTNANQVMVMREMSQPRPTYLLKRGAYDAPGEAVQPQTPHFLPALPGNVPKNRLSLARWLTGPDNPLFNRVTVNRMWQQYFGQGLAKNVDDFGNQGALPSHPELLDYLAVRFRDGAAGQVRAQTAGHWDVKAMHRLIVTSATYRQSSSVPEKAREADPDNTYLSRGPSYRLSAEQVRDNALAASGLLTQKIGGPSVLPYQPAGIWEALATRNAVNYTQHHGDSLYRRSMYTIWKRSSPPPMMLNFDASERHICTVKRQKTATPLQALVTLNDPQFIEAARVMAQRVRQNHIDQFFRLVVSRPARTQEIDLMQQLYAEELADFQKNPKRALELLSVGEYPVDRTQNPAQLAAWTVVASTIMNFDEAIVKR